MRILWHSNAPWAPTGYGQQTGLFARLLRDAGHEVAVSANWGLGGDSLDWDGIRVYPSDEMWGNHTIGPIVADFADGQPVLVITLADVWVFTGDVWADLNIGAWVPVDHAPAPPKVIEFFRRTGATPLAMSRFGQRMLETEGLDPLYVPHGIDTTIFRPADDRDDVRDDLRIPRDAFVVGMVAANKGTAPPRKAFGQVFMAFAEIARQYEDAYLYMHCEFTGVQSGINLAALAAACNIPPDRIKITNPNRMALGVPPARVARLMRAFDVLANPSYGEGFGVPVVEAQACGTPVIVNDVTAMPELCGAGWVVDSEPFWDPAQLAFYGAPQTESIYRAMTQARDRRGDQALRDQAAGFAARYDSRRVMEEYWVPALKHLDRGVSRPRHRATVLREEPWLSRFIPDTGRTALDVGANKGEVAEVLAGRFGRVVAIEPHPDAAATLRDRLPGVQVIEAAAAASPGPVRLNVFESSLQTSAHSDLDLDTMPRGEPAGTIVVDGVVVDDLDLTEVDFAKIDVEGMEADVLVGAAGLLRDQHPALLIEVHSTAAGERCRSLLTEAGYTDVEHVLHPHDGVPAGHHWLFVSAPVPPSAETALTTAPGRV